MRKRIWLTAMAMAVALVVAGCASGPRAAALPTITIVNDTGYEIWFVLVSPVTDENWGNDWLEPQEVIPAGGSVSLTLQIPIEEADRYDIMLVDLDGDSYVRMNVLVRDGATVAFTFDDISLDIE